VRVVADSHAIVWYLQGSTSLSAPARAALAEAEADGGLVVSVVTLIDLWYVTQTTQTVIQLSWRRYASGWHLRTP
jgi:PIN domain nuclease of toxin-antitoxin system